MFDKIQPVRYALLINMHVTNTGEKKRGRMEVPDALKKEENYIISNNPGKHFGNLAKLLNIY